MAQSDYPKMASGVPAKGVDRKKQADLSDAERKQLASNVAKNGGAVGQAKAMTDEAAILAKLQSDPNYAQTAYNQYGAGSLDAAIEESMQPARRSKSSAAMGGGQAAALAGDAGAGERAEQMAAITAMRGGDADMDDMGGVAAADGDADDSSLATAAASGAAGAATAYALYKLLQRNGANPRVAKAVQDVAATDPGKAMIMAENILGVPVTPEALMLEAPNNARVDVNVPPGMYEQVIDAEWSPAAAKQDPAALAAPNNAVTDVRSPDGMTVEQPVAAPRQPYSGAPVSEADIAARFNNVDAAVASQPYGGYSQDWIDGIMNESEAKPRYRVPAAKEEAPAKPKTRVKANSVKEKPRVRVKAGN